MAKRYSQPQSGPARIDPYWISRGLVGAITRISGRLVDVAAGLVPSTNTGTDAVGRAGKVTTFSGSTYAEFTDAAAHRLIGPLTILVGVNIKSFSNYTHFVSKQSTTTTNGAFEFRLGAASATDNLPYFVRANTTYNSWKSFDSSTTLGRNVLAVRCASGLIDAAPDFFVNGLWSTASASGGSGAGAATTGGNLRIARRVDAATQLDGDIEFIWLFNKALLDSEIVALTANPWQVVATTQRRIWGAAAGGAVTHATTGALTGQGSTVAGTAAHIAKHATSGALSGQGSTVAGTAAHIAKHATSGALAGAGAVIAGTAARVASPVTHTTIGVLTGQGSSLQGSAQNGIVTAVDGGSDKKRKQKKQVLKEIGRLNELIIGRQEPDEAVVAKPEPKPPQDAAPKFDLALIQAQARQQIEDEDEEDALMLLIF